MAATAVYSPSGSNGELQFANSSGFFDAAKAYWDSDKSKLYISGNLEVLGTETVIDTLDLQVEDAIIGLGTGSAGQGAAGDRGVIFLIDGETNPSIYWDESANEFRLARLQNVPGDSVFDNPTSIAQSAGGYQGLRVGTISAVSGAILDSKNRATSDIGTNVYFFVSGSPAQRAVFDGDVVISGTLHGGSPLKIGGEMEVQGSAKFAGTPVFQTAPTFESGLIVSGTSNFVNQPKFESGFEVTGTTAFRNPPSFDAGFNVSAGQAIFSAAPKFASGFEVTGAAAFQAAPNFDAGINVTAGQATFADTPNFQSGFQVTGSADISPTGGSGTAILENSAGPLKLFASTRLKLGTGDGYIDLLDLDDGKAGQLEVIAVGENPLAHYIGITTSGSIRLRSSAGVHITGSVSSLTGYTGSLTTLCNGQSYLSAGKGISIVTGSQGSVTITSTASSLFKKSTHEVSSPVPAMNPVLIPGISLSAVSFQANRIDVFVNGQLMTQGALKDYVLPGSENAFQFYFDLIPGDIVTVRTY